METKVAIIFGGKSAEFEVSLNSASNIFNALDKERFDVVLLGIGKQGTWFYNPNYQKENINLQKEDFFKDAEPVIVDRINDKICIINKGNSKVLDTFDVAFSIIHGTYGEDGTLQGYFKSLNIPFVGPDVLGSAISMDKEVTKRLLRDSKVPIADFICLRKGRKEEVSFQDAKTKLGLPMFVKPCNAGSSVGVSKVTDEDTFYQAIDNAFIYDNKILIEEAIIGKEVECAILGNEHPRASIVGEIVPTKDFYSYDAKYNDVEGAKMKIPAVIDPEIEEKIREMAVKAFETVCC